MYRAAVKGYRPRVHRSGADISRVESGREAGGVWKSPAMSYSDFLTFVEHSGDHS